MAAMKWKSATGFVVLILALIFSEATAHAQTRNPFGIFDRGQNSLYMFIQVYTQVYNAQQGGQTISTFQQI